MKRVLAPLIASLWLLTAGAQPAALAPETLPPAVVSALAQARVPASALSALVVDAQGQASPLLSHRADVAVNPASVMKLVSTFAALDLLGPAYTWTTTVHVEGTVTDGVLQGNLYLRGGGDPKLVTEKLWLLMRRVWALGIRRVAGDIVLDRSAFAVPATDPGAFDGEPLRPYNATPDALLINYKSLVMTFTPDATAGVARVSVEPPLAGVNLPTSVPLLHNGNAAACGDWRGGLKGDFRDPQNLLLQGAYPLSCGERVWPLAYPAPERFAERAVLGMWQALGGQLDGRVRDGPVPAGLAARVVLPSPTLTEVVRDVNKFSNNVMAQHVFLALGAGNGQPASFEAARARTASWWRERISADGPLPEVDNGAGLSRNARITSQGLARLLQVAWASGLMPELSASLPVSGLDGTMRRSRAATGLAHLKTGSLNDVVAIAGYVHGASGRRLVLVAVINHPGAHAARGALEALLSWTAAP